MATQTGQVSRLEDWRDGLVAIHYDKCRFCFVKGVDVGEVRLGDEIAVEVDSGNRVMKITVAGNEIPLPDWDKD